ncbi:MAG: class I SAM-dependent methyltransferase, partial [Alphaproteobacteria bacterium]
GADAMRRQALVPLHEFLQGREMPRLRLLDVACGTGRFLSFVKDNHPSLPAIGLDLSPYYLRRAAATLRTWRRTALVQGNAERIPLADKSCDLVSCLFLFHELPRKARVRVANEIGRVLRPGGRLMFLDSIQRGDAPDLDPLLDYFPLAYHEPYFTDYTRTGLEGLFRPAGLRPHSSTVCYLSKLAVFHKPRTGRRSG